MKFREVQFELLKGGVSMWDYIMFFVFIILLIVFAWSYSALYKSLNDFIKENRKNNLTTYHT